MKLELMYDAMMFAKFHHKDQVRKYTGAPYSDHLAEVAGIAVTACPTYMIGLTVCVSWLHDCVEDQCVTYSELEERFGTVVADGVYMLSDLEDGNRATRKQLSRDRLAAAPDWIQTIKCADLISNTSSIVEHDPKFAVTYLEEKRLLLAVLTKADPRLRDIALALANQ